MASTKSILVVLIACYCLLVVSLAADDRVLEFNYIVLVNGTVFEQEFQVTSGSPAVGQREGEDIAVRVYDGDRSPVYSLSYELDFANGITPGESTYLYDRIPYEESMESFELVMDDKVVHSRSIGELCDRNGLCSGGENFFNCPQDCSSGSLDGVCDGEQDGECDTDCLADADFDCHCGDGTCEPGLGEREASCPADCTSGGADVYCDGKLDGRCDPDCSEAEDFDCHCGNAACEPELTENHISCPGDCRSGYRDGLCDERKDGRCDPDCLEVEDFDCHCGDGDCRETLGESIENCPEDCSKADDPSDSGITTSTPTTSTTETPSSPTTSSTGGSSSTTSSTGGSSTSSTSSTGKTAGTTTPSDEATPSPAAPSDEATPSPAAPSDEATPSPAIPSDEVTPSPAAPLDEVTPSPPAPSEPATPQPVLSPSHTPQSKLNEARVHMKDNNPAKALESVNMVLDSEPDKKEALVLKGEILEEMGRKNEALDTYRRIHEIDPDDEAVKERIQKVSKEIVSEPRGVFNNRGMGVLIGLVVAILPVLFILWLEYENTKDVV